MSNCKVIALANQKGGVGKTTTEVNPGVSLAQALYGRRFKHIRKTIARDCVNEPEKIFSAVFPDALKEITESKKLK